MLKKFLLHFQQKATESFLRWWADAQTLLSTYFVTLKIRKHQFKWRISVKYLFHLLICASRFNIFLSFSSYFSTKTLCSRYTLRYSFLMRASCMLVTRVMIRRVAGTDKFCWKTLMALWTFVDFDKLSAINCSICCRMSAKKLKLI